MKKLIIGDCDVCKRVETLKPCPVDGCEKDICWDCWDKHIYWHVAESIPRFNIEDTEPINMKKAGKKVMDWMKLQ